MDRNGRKDEAVPVPAQERPTVEPPRGGHTGRGVSTQRLESAPGARELRPAQFAVDVTLAEAHAECEWVLADREGKGAR